MCIRDSAIGGRRARATARLAVAPRAGYLGPRYGLVAAVDHLDRHCRPPTVVGGVNLRAVQVTDVHDVGQGRVRRRRGIGRYGRVRRRRRIGRYGRVRRRIRRRCRVRRRRRRPRGVGRRRRRGRARGCLLYTSDAADEGARGDLGGRRYI